MREDSFVARTLFFDALDSRSTQLECNENLLLFRQGDRPCGLYLVRSGEVSLTLLSPTGQIVASFSAYSGAVLGMPAVTENASYTLNAIDRKGSEVHFIPADAFWEMLQVNPALYPHVISMLSMEVRAARALLAGPAHSVGSCTTQSNRNISDLSPVAA